MIRIARSATAGASVFSVLCAVAVWSPPAAHADNKRLNDSVVANVYTAQHMNGCTAKILRSPALIEAARVHTLDVLNNRALDGDLGSDGSTPQDRARALGFNGSVAETVAINPALAISGIEILQQWWNDPTARSTMQDCRYTSIGVWSENSFDRSVVVAVYGQQPTN